jgi:hypothetical protein
MLSSFAVKRKTPLGCASAGLNLKSADDSVISGTHPRRHAMRVMMMAVMDVRQHQQKSTGRLKTRQDISQHRSADFSILPIENLYAARIRPEPA